MSKGFPMLPQAARAIERLRAAGHEAWIVGGCVRDVLLGRTPTDYDLTTSALPEETEAVFAGERLIETGLQHGTVTVVLEGVPLEITTYRVDGGYTDARHPDGVTFTRSLREDAARRDFTINAMAYAPGEGLQDFFGGQADSCRRGHPRSGGGGPAVSGGRPAHPAGDPVCFGAGLRAGPGDGRRRPEKCAAAPKNFGRAGVCGAEQIALRPGGGKHFAGLPGYFRGGAPGADADGGVCAAQSPPLL